MRMIEPQKHLAHSDTLSELNARAEKQGFLLKIMKLAKNLGRRRDVRSLHKLNGYLLRDIGLERGDLDWALSVPFHADPSRRLEEVR